MNDEEDNIKIHIKANQYKEIKLLSKSNNAVVYQVKDYESNIVFVKKGITVYSEFDLQEIINEIRILDKLNSSHNIVTIHDFYIEKYYNSYTLNIITEYINNGDLKQLINKHLLKKTYIKEHVILNIFSQICVGLKFIHSNNILHRDIKPSNIFITKNQKVKIGDFGYSKSLNSSMEKALSLVGTPYYFSPEICNGKVYSFKSDIWSLGVTLYELCTLHVPFEGKSILEVIKKIKISDYKPISNKYSSSLGSLIKSMMEVDEDKRICLNDILNLDVISNRILTKEESFNTSSSNSENISNDVK